MDSLTTIQQITAAVFIIGLSLSFLHSLWKRKQIALGNSIVTALPLAIFVYFVFLVQLPFDIIKNEAVQAGGLVIIIIGLLLSKYAYEHIGLINSDDFWWSRKKEKKRHLVVTGPYRYVRHPLSLGIVISYAGLVIVFFHLISFIIFMISLIAAVVTSFAEEKFMQEKFPEYESYKKRSGMFIPKL